jgi:nitronate monooxygenase
MGTRFLMTKESPVPLSTLERYVAVRDTERIRVSRAVDGMPQRMIDNPFLERLESAGAIRRIVIALRSAWRWKARTGMSVGQMIATAMRALREEDMSVAQTIMAANAPVLIQRAMVEGFPDEGVLPSGQVAAAINELQSCAEVIDGIVSQAQRCLDALEEQSSPPIRRGATR